MCFGSYSTVVLLNFSILISLYMHAHATLQYSVYHNSSVLTYSIHISTLHYIFIISLCQDRYVQYHVCIEFANVAVKC